MTLCVIPARGGSKRIPRKNVVPFRGRPMIAWSIEAARSSGAFERIVVSTDDEEIAAAARDAGAATPFARPTELAGDHVGTREVVAHAVQALSAEGEAVCCLYATAPLVRAEDLCAGLALLESSGCDYAFSAATFAAPVHRAFVQAGRGVEMLFPENFGKRSQDLPAALHDAGQFYWALGATWCVDAPLFGPRSAPLVLPRWRVQDIDDLEDLRRAEALHAMLDDGA